MTIKEKIKLFYQQKKFSRIIREVADGYEEVSRGYIVDHSKDFIVLQETDDFEALGFNILPIRHLKSIRHSNHESYYDKIMLWENEKEKVGLKTKVNLKNWKSIFKTFLMNKMNVIVECENPNISSFTIGPVKEVTDKSVYIQYFDAAGFLDKKTTKINVEDISKVMFDDRYIDIFSKYIRTRKK